MTVKNSQNNSIFTAWVWNFPHFTACSYEHHPFQILCLLAYRYFYIMHNLLAMVPS